MLYNRHIFSNKTISQYSLYGCEKAHLSRCFRLYYFLPFKYKRQIYIHTSLRFQYTKHSAFSFMIILKRYSKCCFMSPETLDKNQLYVYVWYTSLLHNNNMCTAHRALSHSTRSVVLWTYFIRRQNKDFFLCFFVKSNIRYVL